MDEGNLRFPQIITASTDAGRAWFARGWMHMLNYNHEEAAECFKICTEVDPRCAMAFWGIGEC
ncbi:unnamed protein product, partial [Ectocarpus sp. 8 AP-2014]